MSNNLTVIDQIGFLNMLWIFFFIFVVHEFEEWNIDQFEHKNFEGLPPEATDRSARTWIVFVCLVGLIWCAGATLTGNPTIAAWIFLPAISIMFQNGMQHIYWSFLFKQYTPGVITAALLMIPFGFYVSVRAIEMGFVPIWYAAVWAAFILAGFIQTVRAGNKMTPLIRNINALGIWLSNRIR